MNLLVCTLGSTWAVVPEMLGFLDPAGYPLYRNHPAGEPWAELRKRYRLTPPDEIWVCTTGGFRAAESVEKLSRWWRDAGIRAGLRVWVAAETDGLLGEEECRRMQELQLRVTLHAAETTRSSGDRLFLSLAGGRKTMSADLQRGGMVFGCDALLHVVAPDKGAAVAPLREAEPETFFQPLPPEQAEIVTPICVGVGYRSELLELSDEQGGPIDGRRFPLQWPDIGQPLVWSPESGAEWLGKALQERERQGGQLLGNYLESLSRSEHHENWRNLYRLPPRTIDQLRNTALDSRHRDLLLRLPKADLHHHIGGSLNLAAQRRVGQAVWQELTATERAAALDKVAPLLREHEWPWEWPESLKADREMRAASIAALWNEVADETIQHNLYGVTEPRVALNERHPRGFSAYERPGELAGSALLSHRAALEPYLNELIEQQEREGVAYLELRLSPAKYDPSGEWFMAEANRILRGRLQSGNGLQVRLLIIADRRHGEEGVASTVNAAVADHQRYPSLVAGIDLAGDEKNGITPAGLSSAFMPAFEACLPITVHAGEGESVERIWEAAYHLHADRIGHGLTLSSNSDLMRRFRDRGVCVEVCPTSNREVVGFRDPLHPDSEPYGLHPVRQYWEYGLPVTICTDNPGIGRTTLADEYLATARMSENEWTIWDAMALIKQGFIGSFLPADERERLLKEVDRTIYSTLLGLTGSE